MSNCNWSGFAGVCYPLLFTVEIHFVPFRMRSPRTSLSEITDIGSPRPVCNPGSQAIRWETEVFRNDEITLLQGLTHCASVERQCLQLTSDCCPMASTIYIDPIATVVVQCPCLSAGKVKTFGLSITSQTSNSSFSRSN